MQDFVGIGVSDTAEEPGIGESPLESMVLTDQSFSKGPDTRLQNLETTRIEPT